jgi:hypothetical protein
MPTDSEVSQKSAGLKVLKYNHVSFDKKLLALFEFLIRDSRLQTCSTRFQDQIMV